MKVNIFLAQFLVQCLIGLNVGYAATATYLGTVETNFETDSRKELWCGGEISVSKPGPVIGVDIFYSHNYAAKIAVLDIELILAGSSQRDSKIQKYLSQNLVYMQANPANSTVQFFSKRAGLALIAANRTAQAEMENSIKQAKISRNSSAVTNLKSTLSQLKTDAKNIKIWSGVSLTTTWEGNKNRAKMFTIATSNKNSIPARLDSDESVSFQSLSGKWPDRVACYNLQVTD